MKRHISILSLSLLVAACGGSGTSSSQNPSTNPNPNPSSSKSIKVIGITGINYQIGSRTGVIKNGTKIDYENGDEITFSLGKLELAKVKAKDEISLADFWPKLPATAKEFRSGLRQRYSVSAKLESLADVRQDYRYGAQPTLHRTSNIMQLLLAMDADGDTSNGIDLVSGDWSTKLAEFNENTLPLNSHLAKFSEDPQVRAFSHTHSLPLNMGIATPLSALYQMVNKTINVQPVTGYTTINSSPERTFTYEFNDKMQLRLEKVTVKNSPSVYKKVYTYDTAGNRTQELYQSDGSNGRQSLNVYEYSYNNYGLKQKNSYKRYIGSSSVAVAHTLTNYVIKDDKTLLQRHSTRHQITPKAYAIFESEYNEQGLPIKKETNRYSADGKKMYTLGLQTTTYNDNGTPSKWVKHLYSTSHYHGKYEYTYTYSDKQIQSSKQHFRNAATPSGNIFLLTDKFDDQNRLVEQLTQIQDINSNTSTTRKLKTYEYDSQGRLTSCTTKNYDPSGKLESQSRHRREYVGKDLSSAIKEMMRKGSDKFIIFGQIKLTYGDDGRILTESPTKSAKYAYADAYAADGVAYLVHEMMLIDDKVLGKACDN